ncbi:hypothetical protein Cni_G22065 [Canna indica]|uniref:Uncharacterized protein n=1 Tax=Canna indica TaxID=4628 RepID=A0AAQ3QHX4_9LILI|nr:hypothetical protein Cni_G22065 [Canna indica]
MTEATMASPHRAASPGYMWRGTSSRSTSSPSPSSSFSRLPRPPPRPPQRPDDARQQGTIAGRDRRLRNLLDVRVKISDVGPRQRGPDSAGHSWLQRRSHGRHRAACHPHPRACSSTSSSSCISSLANLITH